MEYIQRRECHPEPRGVPPIVRGNTVMPQHTHRRTAAPASRHGRPATHRRTRAIAFAVVVAGGTAFVAGPATADDRPRRAHVQAVTLPPDRAALGPIAGAGPVAAFESLLEQARQRSLVAQAAERQRLLAEEQEKRAALVKKKARALSAKVRSSRAALRSDVVRPIASGYRLTASFGDSSSRWGSGTHTGLDFACSTGTAVRAVAGGVVIAAGFDGAYGNRIEVRHADGTVTTYNHLSSLNLRSGRISAGQMIGRVGSTGNTTGAHLHFEVLKNGRLIDPGHWLAVRYVPF